MTKSPLRVGLVCHSGIGGSVRIAVELAAELSERGHVVHLFSRTRPMMTSFGHRVAFHGLEGLPGPFATHRLETEWPPAEEEAFLSMLESVAASSRLDVLHFHYAVPFARIAGRLRGRMGSDGPRIVMTLHGTDVSTFGFHPRVGPELALALGEFDAVTTVSRSHAALAASAFGLPGPPRIVPNFVDLRRFRPRRRLPFGLRTSRRRLAHVSNFRPVKNPGTIARVFASVRQHHDAELWLVGDGDGMAGVRSILRSRGVDQHVRFFGLRREVHRIIRQADALLITSRTESFGLVALEAAACGVPVIAPRVGGLPEVVADGSTGFLFRPGDEEGAADSVSRLFGDERMRARMGREGVSRAQLFSSRSVVGRYELLYGQLLAASRERARPAPTGPSLLPAGA